jgi:hypothetical protein
MSKKGREKYDNEFKKEVVHPPIPNTLLILQQ